VPRLSRPSDNVQRRGDRTDVDGRAFSQSNAGTGPSQGDENGEQRTRPIHHTQKMQKRLLETMQHLRKDIQKVDEPQLKAMFETSAEVLGGLVKAFRDYEEKNEFTWR
jgi:hypothetical protein